VPICEDLPAPPAQLNPILLLFKRGSSGRWYRGVKPRSKKSGKNLPALFSSPVTNNFCQNVIQDTDLHRITQIMLLINLTRC